MEENRYRISIGKCPPLPYNSGERGSCPMGIFRDDWQELTESRNVGSIYLTHLIRGRSDNDSYNTLLKILESGFLRASFSKRSGYNTVKGDKEVVCFQDTSFDEMNEVITGEKWI